MRVALLVTFTLVGCTLPSVDPVLVDGDAGVVAADAGSVSLTDAARSDAGPPEPRECGPTADLRIASPSNEAERVFNLVLDEQMETLDQLVGRFARGDAPVYAGRVAARDNKGAYGRGYVDGVLMEGDVVAGLAYNEWSELHFLNIASPSQRTTIWLRQSEASVGRTEAGPVLRLGEYFGLGMTGWCTDCLPLLAEHPETLSLDLTATSTWGAPLLTVQVSGELRRVPPSELTFEQIAWANAEMLIRQLPFTQRGDEMVRTYESAVTESVPVPEGIDFQSCGRETRYTIEWYVRSDCPIDYGVHNLSIIESQTCCRNPPGPDCMIAMTCF